MADRERMSARAIPVLLGGQGEQRILRLPVHPQAVVTGRCALAPQKIRSAAHPAGRLAAAHMGQGPRGCP